MRAEALRRRDLTLPHLGMDFDSDDDANSADAALLAGGGASLEYHVPSTGACVTLSNAKSLLFYFCHKLPSDRYASGVMRPRFSTTILEGPHGPALPAPADPAEPQTAGASADQPGPLPLTAASPQQHQLSAVSTPQRAIDLRAQPAAVSTVQQHGSISSDEQKAHIKQAPAADMQDSQPSASTASALACKQPQPEDRSATEFQPDAMFRASSNLEAAASAEEQPLMHQQASGPVILMTTDAETEVQTVLPPRTGNPKRCRKSRKLARLEAAAAAAMAGEGEADEEGDQQQGAGCWFQAQALLPNNCPVLRAEGPPQPKRSLAVAAACVEAIRLLHQAGAMSDYLIPDAETMPEPEKDMADDLTPLDQLPDPSEDPNAAFDLPRLANIAPKVPDILKQPPPSVQSGLSKGFLRVHVYRFHISLRRQHPDDDKELRQPMGLVVPCELPPLPGFNITLATGTVALATLVHLGCHSVSPERMAQIRQFHDCMCEVSAARPKAGSTVPQPQTITDTPLAKRRRTGPNPIADPSPLVAQPKPQPPAHLQGDGAQHRTPDLTGAVAGSPQQSDMHSARLLHQPEAMQLDAGLAQAQQHELAAATPSAAAVAAAVNDMPVSHSPGLSAPFANCAAGGGKPAGKSQPNGHSDGNSIMHHPQAVLKVATAEALDPEPAGKISNSPTEQPASSPILQSMPSQPAPSNGAATVKQVSEARPGAQLGNSLQSAPACKPPQPADGTLGGFFTRPIKRRPKGPSLTSLKGPPAVSKPAKVKKLKALSRGKHALPANGSRQTPKILSNSHAAPAADDQTMPAPSSNRQHTTANVVQEGQKAEALSGSDPPQKQPTSTPAVAAAAAAAAPSLSNKPRQPPSEDPPAPSTATGAVKQALLPAKRKASDEPAAVPAPDQSTSTAAPQPVTTQLQKDAATQPAKRLQSADALQKRPDESSQQQASGQPQAPRTPIKPAAASLPPTAKAIKPMPATQAAPAAVRQTAPSPAHTSVPPSSAARASKSADIPADALPGDSAAPQEPAWGLAVVPLLAAAAQTGTHFKPAASADQIDWKGLDKMAKERMPIPWDSMGRWALEDFLADAMLVTSYNSMMYSFRGMEYNMNPSMVMPMTDDVRGEHESSAADGPAGSKRKRPELGAQQTFINYYRGRWGVGGIKPQQPLIKVVSKDARFADSSEEEKLIYLVPQLCLVHPLRAAAVRAAKRLLPRLLWQVQVLLLAAELRGFMAKFMQEVLPSTATFRQPELQRMVEAVTPQASQEGYSYEVLENLGDAFVKYSTCLSLFTSFPSAHEGQLTARKDRLVSNVSLARVGLRLGLECYIALPWKAYSFRSGCVAAPARQMRIKVVADCVEALTGAFLLAGGEQAGFAFVAGALELLPMISPLAPAPRQPGIGSKSVRALERALGYTFRDARLAREACTHCSWPDNATPSYQRLEFLGDALIDLGVTRYFATTFRNITPGRMHDLRSASVNNTRMSCAAAARRLHTFLRYMSAQLFGDIKRFMDGLRDSVKAKKEVMLRADFAQLQRQPLGPDGQRRRDKLTLEAKRRVYDETVQEAGFGHSGIAGAPKVLGDIVEALAAAVYLDSGRNLELTWKIFGDMLSPLPKPDTVPMHPVRDILERSNKAGFTFKFEATQASEEGSTALAAVVDGVVLGKCTSAPNMKAARLLSAKDAIHNWARAPAAKPGSVTALQSDRRLQQHC